MERGVPTGSSVTSSPAAIRRSLYPVSRLHLEAMSDEIGLWQHALGTLPNRRFGYCADDVARSLIVDTLQSRQIGWPGVASSVVRSLTFLEGAFDARSGRFRNLRDAHGDWLENDASEDCHARALAGLAAVAAERPGSGEADRAAQLFGLALPAAVRFTAPRAIAMALLACGTAKDAGLAAGTRPSIDRLVHAIADLFMGVRVSRPLGSGRLDWPWPESTLTYENALLPHALVVGGQLSGRPELVIQGCDILDWLIEVETSEGGNFSPVGNKGWWPRDGDRSQFDQQPIEATTLIAAAAAALQATGQQRYLNAAEAAYGWFLGANDLAMPVADPRRGACHDGLRRDGLNPNQGAESTLMWLSALERIRRLREAAGTTAERETGDAIPGAASSYSNRDRGTPS